MVDSLPAPAAPTDSTDVSTTASGNTFAATELDRPAVATEAPTAAAPALTPPVNTTWVDGIHRHDGNAVTASAGDLAAKLGRHGIGDIADRHRRLRAEVERGAAGDRSRCRWSCRRKVRWWRP